MKRIAFISLFLLISVANTTFAKRYSDAELATMFVTREKPYYPAELRRRGITGSGRFRLYIDEQGRVTKIGVLESTGNKALDVSAMRAMVHWRAKPGPKREVDQPCTFTLLSPITAKDLTRRWSQPLAVVRPSFP